MGYGACTSIERRAGLFEYIFFPVHNMEMGLAAGTRRVECLISAEQIRGRVAELGRRIAADYPPRDGDPPLHLIGVLKGAAVFVADLARAIDREVSFDFVAVRSYGGEVQSSGEIRLTKDIEEEIAGRDVLLVEDIVDTGLTVKWLCNHLRRRGPRTLRVAALLDKPGRRVEPVELKYVGFEIPDEFVVGYGLDYAQRYRNLADICVLRGLER
jgi:hypoxanthine phosphoribosyltransferase